MTTPPNGQHATIAKISDAAKKKKARALAEREEREDPLSVAETRELTDVGQAERIGREHCDELRFVRGWGTWIVYQGGRWHLDEKAKRVEGLAIETVDGMLAEAARDLAETVALKDEDGIARAKRRFAWAERGHEARRIRDAVSLIPAANPGLMISHDELDADPWALNVTNGTLDLRSGALRPHRPGDLLTKMAGAAFDPNATCPTWDAFVLRAMGGDRELVAYLQRLIGYSLTGEIREHILGFFYGSGANGKSTFLNVVQTLLGDYATRAPRNLLFRNQGSSHETNLTTLHGARLAVAPEVDQGAAFDEGLVKDLTGGDVISARRMREDFWEFKPTHKLFLAGNHLPRVKGTDEGIWRRMRLVPWNVTIPASERDTELPTKLLGELSGILGWALRGCLDWQSHGLGEPVAVSEATAQYREDSDPLREFFAGHCVFAPPERIARRFLREAYESYSKENGAEPLGAKRFNDALRDHGVSPKAVRFGSQVLDGWAGVRLKTDKERFVETREEGARHGG